LTNNAILKIIYHINFKVLLEGENAMMDGKSNEPKLLNGIISIAPTKHIDALLILCKKLEDKNLDWAVGGDLGEVLLTVNVEPDCIEIYTSKEGTERIVEATSEFNPSPVTLETQQLSRNAIIEGKEYPVYIRSYYSELKIGEGEVKIYGDAQYRLDNWDWGDRIEFIPEYVYVVGNKITVVPLSFKYEYYRSLGWRDRAEQIKQTIDRQRKHSR
jgi:hypothetical protein